MKPVLEMLENHMVMTGGLLEKHGHPLAHMVITVNRLFAFSCFAWNERYHLVDSDQLPSTIPFLDHLCFWVLS